MNPKDRERYWMQYASVVRSLPESTSVADRHQAALEAVVVAAHHEIVDRLILEARHEYEQLGGSASSQRARALQLHLNRLIRFAADLHEES